MVLSTVVQPIGSPLRVKMVLQAGCTLLGYGDFRFLSESGELNVKVGLEPFSIDSDGANCRAELLYAVVVVVFVWMAVYAYFVCALVYRFTFVIWVAYIEALYWIVAAITDIVL
ncbi:hypothetical protein M8C21_032878 [Ambrosia artemisiifolia]|uniref:Uncharacterized protein n=1 Tax=Ambrosia artemisiifolia TaxID=4212 RepID=A0AAD5D4H1_AMBAR|nr:hypothetical protein M8C21_032878 [Ambrosia artemisiifolia]